MPSAVRVGAVATRGGAPSTTTKPKPAVFYSRIAAAALVTTLSLSFAPDSLAISGMSCLKTYIGVFLSLVKAPPFISFMRSLHEPYRCLSLQVARVAKVFSSLLTGRIFPVKT